MNYSLLLEKGITSAYSIIYGSNLLPMVPAMPAASSNLGIVAIVTVTTAIGKKAYDEFVAPPLEILVSSYLRGNIPFK